MIITIKKKLEETLIPEHLRAAGIIPVLAYDEDDHVFLMDDQSVGFGFMCEPLCGADEKVQERMNGFLNQEFPSKTSLQFVLFRSPDINQEMYRMMGLRDGFRHELLTSVIKERINFLQHHTTDRILAKTSKGIYDNGLIQDLKLFVTCKVPIKNNNPTESELQHLAQIRTKVESSLQTVGLRPRTMTAVNYIRIMSTILNWGPDASWRHDSVDWEMDKPICEQIFDYGTDVEVSKNGIRLGDYHAKVMSAKKLPDVFYFGDALTYAGDLSGGKSVDLAIMLAHASLHDAAEVLCSDVVTPVKKANAVLQREFERLEKAAEDKLIQTLPEELQDAVSRAFAPGGYEQSLVKACDTYSAYIKCKLEVAAGNGIEFQDALSKMERIVAQVKLDFPEIDALDKWFGDGLGHSVDKLLAGGNDD